MTQKVPLSLNEIENRLSTFSFPDIDLVVGIASGGVYPADMIAAILKKPLSVIEIKFRSKANIPLHETPRLVKMDDISPGISRILLVDDVCVSGKTIDLAKRLLSDYKIITFVLKGKADLVLFPEISTCVSWPWYSREK
jgi:hypoxanthine phosphoribosyltransferase